MLVQVTGSTNALAPFDVFICNSATTYCFYVSGLTYLNPIVSFNTQNYFPSEDYLYLKIIDTNGCTDLTLLDCTGP